MNQQPSTPLELKRFRSILSLPNSGKRDTQSIALLGCLLALVIAFSMASPYFLTARNLTNVLLSVTVIGTIAPVMTLVLISRHLDLSVGSIMALVAVVIGLLLEQNFSAFATIGLALLLGLACGVFNGGLIVAFRIDSIIVTIATLSILRGLAYVISDGQTIVVGNDLLLDVGSGRAFGIPYSVGLMLAIFILCHVVGAHTRVGRAIYAIGSNPRASRLSGISLGRHRFYVFAASGVSAAVAAILFVGQSASAVPSAGIGYELLVLTAVLLGGASLHGGEGRIFGTLLGVLIIGVLNNGMILLGVSSYLQMVAQGSLLLVAVALDQLRRSPPA